MATNEHKFPYKWYLKDGYPAKGIEKNKYKVFGTFICGGGSTMGYKLAGFEHFGGVEIDKKVAEVYELNHKPKHLYNMDIRAFNGIENLPQELYDLDILDGSPPCSTFSMAGSREKAWGEKKQFREGQAKQVLDDLVFIYCETIKKLMPKIFILENVTGIIKGNAKAYSKEIGEVMASAGYKVEVFQLNAASMGVPQKRERVFFIGRRKEFDLPKLDLSFNENPILFGELKDNTNECDLPERELNLWRKRELGDNDFRAINIRMGNVGKDFSCGFLYDNRVAKTILADDKNVLFSQPRRITNAEAIKIGTYPLDYNFKEIQPKYLIGMSVPPVMTAQISHQIKLQWLDKIKSKN